MKNERVVKEHPGKTSIDRRKIRKAVREVVRLSGADIPLNPIPIPRKFMLGGIWIDVEVTEDLVHKDNAFGQANFNDNKIKIQPNVQGSPRSAQDIERTFCHELMHFLCHMAGEYEFRDNEQKIDVFSRLLHQSLKTAIYK